MLQIVLLESQPVIHEPPKVPSKSARERTETKPHGVDDHLVYVARERELEREVDGECQQENWVRRLMLSVGSG